MELPHLGQHCSDPSCKRLDFLPVKCDACQNIFCSEHYVYANHQCPEAYRKDNQVPVCPLCNNPVPFCGSGELPDIVVGQHIDNDCQSETAQSHRKVFSNKCMVKGCKRKEVVPVMCEQCHMNFCLRHRHEMDHNCQHSNKAVPSLSASGTAALARLQVAHGKDKLSSFPQKLVSGKDVKVNQPQKQPTRLTASEVHSLQQPTLTEEEAMRMAMAMSLDSSHSQPYTQPISDADRRHQEELDEALARALQQSEQDAAGHRPTNTAAGQQRSEEKTSCKLS